MNSYDYDGALIAAAVGLLVFSILVIAVVYVLSSIFYMKIFEKAGVQGKWRAWVPVYNTMVFSKLGDLSPWLVLIAFGGAIVLWWIPVLNVLAGLISAAGGIVLILAAYRVGQKLQKEGAWVVLYIFLSIIWLGIMAFDKSRWNTQIAPAPWAGNSFFGDRTVWEGVPVQPSAAAAPGAVPGYGAPQGYQHPGTYQHPGGYPQQAPGQQPPAPGYQQPGYNPPAAPATPPAPPAAPAPPPAAPSTPPAAPSTPRTPPPAAPPAPPADPNQPPA